MKLKNFIALVIIAAAFIGCKDDKKTTEGTAAVKPAPVDSKVQVILNMIVPQDDTFQVYFTENGSASVTSDQAVTVPVKGSAAPQDIVFNIPEDVTMNYLRIDVGDNAKQGKMTMNTFTYKYFDKKFTTKGAEFFLFFNPTEQIAVDMATSTITPTGKGSTYDPIFYPYLEKLGPEFDKINKGQ
ncbi:hypothetical protein [Flavobacterium sp. 3HN19-14]|uniref:hypothetical protein n=1 Tax=Flavobacterium sp. 3HN19-14 TaxID=3448133 RepID=UPI003EE3F608